MLGSRLSIALVLLTFAVALGLTSRVEAQVPPVLAVEVPGTVTIGGDYTARVTEPGQDFWDRSGTYLASVAFTASVQVFVASITPPSGSYQASGPFTATVSAPDTAPFVVTGTYTATGTFSAGTFTSSGEWAVNTGGTASGSHRGGGTYDLGASTVFANGQWDGVATTSARGPFNIDGTYGGNGSYTVGVRRISTSESLQLETITDLIAGIAGTTASAPTAAAALELQNPTRPTTTPGAASTGKFSGTIASTGVSIVSFTGTTAQLNTVAAAAKVITVSTAVGGKMLSFVVGAPAFVNTEFNAAYPMGLNGTLVIVKT